MKPVEAVNYKTNWLIREANGRSHITSVLEDIKQNHAIQQCDVLELGSGIGTNLSVFSTNNRVLGVEGMNEAVMESNARGIATIQADLAEPVALLPNCADWILCIDVLEHLMNPVVCLDSARKLLRPDGHLIVNVPNHFDWRGRMRVLQGSGIDSQGYFPESRIWEYPHVRFFQRVSIEELIHSTGFTVVEDYSHRFNTFPKAALLNRIGARSILQSIQKRWPDIFSGGHFLICRKSPLPDYPNR
jgi:2-polyprenyl-3-methyl-5-hydroxy-6-metoxy-1,4-benzoquinol methylase